ncbi:MAG: serine/threonine protein kinase [Deltaproteobacteria bacterium]|nr:serine/threonine protein kinase [Deltaproteobacteria bacterium]
MSERLAGGRFTVVRRLAQGGMGEVLLAEFGGDSALRLSAGLLVIKRVLPDHPNRAHQADMLREEGRVALRLLHETLVETFCVDEHDGDPLLVMEFLSGRAMSQVLGQAKKRKEKVPVEVSLALLRAAACGLHFAHTLQDRGRPLGLIHRDVSPANLFVTFDGRVKVIDFGVAKADDSEIRTSTGILKGTLGYMSPEHALGETLAPAADLWSLGVLFWETLCAERLFAMPSPSQTLAAISERPVPPPTTLRSDLPKHIVDLCMRLLERDLKRRVATGAELVQLIDQLPEAGALSRVDLGGWLSQRFPEEADLGQSEAAHCARLQRRVPVPMGLVEGSAQSVAGDDEVPTLVIGAQAMLQAVDRLRTDELSRETQPNNPALGSSSEASVRAQAPAGRPGGLLADPAEASQPHARSPEIDLSPTDVLPADFVAQALKPLNPGLAEAEISASRRAPTGTSSSFSGSGQLSSTIEAAALQSTSWVAVAGLTFGVLAVAMGVGFAFAAPLIVPTEVYAYDAPAGHEVLVAAPEHAPDALRTRRVSLASPKVRFPGEPAPQPHTAAELEGRLKGSGVWARAALPPTLRAQVAVILPVVIAGLGLLALAFSLPGLLLRRRVPRTLARVAMLAGVSVGIWVALQQGALSWPGLQAWRGAPRLELSAPNP